VSANPAGGWARTAFEEARTSTQKSQKTLIPWERSSLVQGKARGQRGVRENVGNDLFNVPQWGRWREKKAPFLMGQGPKPEAHGFKTTFQEETANSAAKKETSREALGQKREGRLHQAQGKWGGWVEKKREVSPRSTQCFAQREPGGGILEEPTTSTHKSQKPIHPWGDNILREGVE